MNATKVGMVCVCACSSQRLPIVLIVSFSFFHSVKNELATFSDAEIMAKVETPDVQLANAMGRPNPGTELDITPDGFSIKIDPDLDIRKMEGILLVWQTEEGVLESKFTTTNEGEGPSPLKVYFGITKNILYPIHRHFFLFLQLTHLLRAVWCTNNKRLPTAEVMDYKCKEVIKLSCLPRMAEEIFQARTTERTKVCSICGDSFRV